MLAGYLSFNRLSLGEIAHQAEMNCIDYLSPASAHHYVCCCIASFFFHSGFMFLTICSCWVVPIIATNLQYKAIGLNVKHIYCRLQRKSTSVVVAWNLKNFMIKKQQCVDFKLIMLLPLMLLLVLLLLCNYKNQNCCVPHYIFVSIFRIFFFLLYLFLI